MMEIKTRSGTIFRNCEKSNDGKSEPLETVIKVTFKTNNDFNSTMMASFLPVILSQKNQQTQKYVFYCNFTQIHMNPEKKHEKTHQNNVLWCT